MERRGSRRLGGREIEEIQVSTVPEGYRLHVLNTAMGGMRLRCDQGLERIQLSEILLINILLDMRRLSEVACLICYIKQNKMSYMDFGIRFLNIREDDHLLLYSYLEMQRLISS